MAATRQPLGGGIVTLIVIDAVLVLILLVMLLQLGRADDPGQAGSGDGGTTSPTSTDGTGEPVAFTLPSRNITCTIGSASAGCGIVEFEYAPPAVEGCSGRTGHEIEVTAEGARWLCTTGEPPAAGDGVEVLEYGSSASANGFTCQSSPEGVTCRHDGSGHGFSLARAGATLD